MRKFLGLFIFTLLSTSLAFASQDVELTHNNLVSATTSSSSTSGNSHYVVTCDDGLGFFSDRNGNHKPYDNDSDYYVTICAEEGDKAVSVNFQQFKLEKFDNLSVWDELRTEAVTSTSTPEARNSITGSKDRDDGIVFKGTFTGPASPGVINSTFGCLTFRFRSDRSVVENGWYARIGCADRNIPTSCDLADNVRGDIDCGETIKDDNFSGENNFTDYGDCNAWPSPGRELIYRFVNHKVRDLKFRLQEDNGSQPKLLNMYIVRQDGANCSSTDCIDAVVRPSAAGDEGRDSVELKNAAIGTYYIIIDANQVYGHNWFKLSLECTAGDFSSCSNPYYYDDFERADDDPHRPRPDIDYHEGDYVSIVNPFWTKSSGLRHARISTDRASNGEQSLEFNRLDEGAQDAFLDLGQKFRGAYRICFSLFVEKNRTAFFGVFGTNGDPWGAINKEFAHNSVYQGRWIDVEIFVDLDRNDYVLYLDNRSNVFTGDFKLNLDKLMFYGLPNAHFYVDAICYQPVDGRRIPRPSSRVASTLGDTPLFTADLQYQAANGVTTDIFNTTDVVIATPKLNATDLKVVPNPTRGLTTIALDLEKAQNIELQIFSPAGQVVRQISLGETSIVREELNLGDLANGLYILRATGETSVITKKIILQQ